LEDTHGLVVAAVALPDNVILDPTQTVLFPVIVGFALMVIVAVTEQLLLFVYVIVVVPALTPVTRPFVTVATAVLLEVHGFVVAGEPDPVNCIVDPTQTGELPEIVGFAFTVID